MKRLAALALALLLSGCAGSAALGPALSGVTGQIPGQAAGLFGIPAATISQQMVAEIAGLQPVVTQFQMLKAQLDGASIALPPIPFPGTPITPPPPPPLPPLPPVVNPPGGPIVTPNARARRHASLDMRGGTLTPPSDLRSMFGSDGHLRPSVMVQPAGL